MTKLDIQFVQPLYLIEMQLLKKRKHTTPYSILIYFEDIKIESFKVLKTFRLIEFVTTF